MGNYHCTMVFYLVKLQHRKTTKGKTLERRHSIDPRRITEAWRTAFLFGELDFA